LLVFPYALSGRTSPAHVVNSCTMINPIVFVELHLVCTLALQSPASLFLSTIP